MYKKFEPVTRAPTPCVFQPEGDDEDEAIALLQRLLRGRAMQNQMFAGKQRNINLISELRVEEDPPAEVDGHDSSKMLYTAVDTIQGEVISGALNFISKEVVRVHDYRKIDKMVWIADQKRRIREAEESGRRQVDDALRKKNEQQFARNQETHASTADTFLDAILDDAVDEVAEGLARKENKLKSNYLDGMLDDFEEKFDDDENAAQDLVANFLLPEVERQLQDRRAMLEDRRFNAVSNEIVQHAFEKAATVNGWTQGS